MIGVLVADDSAFMRRAIVKILESEDDIAVIGTARNGEEAVEKTIALHPDVVTMDVEMPEVDGLEAVRRIVAQSRVPIIMVSAHTREGAAITFRALELGAVDFIAKPDAAYTQIGDVARDLVEKVRACAGVRAQPTPLQPFRESEARSASPSTAPPARTGYECVAIGASTGGPVALTQIVSGLSERFPVPVLVVQHMPRGFTGPFAQRLDAAAKISVREGSEGMIVEPASVTIAPAGSQLELRRSGNHVTMHLGRDEDSPHVPSVDALGIAVAAAYGESVGVILTGMGRDGVDGLRHIKERGGYIVGQDEASCVVYGMPRAAALAGLVDRVAPPVEIPRILCGLLGTGS